MEKTSVTFLILKKPYIFLDLIEFDNFLLIDVGLYIIWNSFNKKNDNLKYM